MADTLDILTLAEGKAALKNGTAAASDTTLATYITMVSRRLDQWCGPVVKRSVTLVASGGGTVSLRLYPVYAVTSLTEYTGTTGTVLTAYDVATQLANTYDLDSESGLLYRYTSGTKTNFAAGRKNVVLVYEAGRFANTTSVDPLFKGPAMFMLNDLWSRWQGGGTQMFPGVDGAEPYSPELMRDVKLMLGDEWRAPMVA